MDNSMISENRDVLSNLISENAEIGIIIGEVTSLDKAAAGLSLYLTLKEIGKDSQVVSKREPTVEVSNLVGIDKIKKEFSGLIKTYTISLPYNEGEIEKVSYKIENNRLNINLFAGEKKISFSESEIDYIKKGAIPSVVFAIGVADPERLASFFDPNSEIKLINIDNNENNNGYGDVSFVSNSFSSVSEIVAKIMIDLGLPINTDIAQNLMDGISSATENFTAYTTSPIAFETASFLMKKGAKRRNVKERQERSTPSFGKAFIPQKSNPVTDNNINSVNGNTQLDNDYGEQNDNSDNVPKDWFTPKVFKSKKDNT